MTPDESAWVRHVKLLREAVSLGARPMCSFQEWAAALTAAIAALEALGRQGVIVATGPAAHCSDPDCNETAPAPSETAKDERFRALEGALLAATKALHFIATDRREEPWQIRQFAQAREGAAYRALHPHQSWCRTEHEGACVPSERPEP